MEEVDHTLQVLQRQISKEIGSAYVCVGSPPEAHVHSIPRIGAGRIRVVQVRARRVDAGNEQRDAEWPRHRLLLAAAKAEREIAHGLRDGLDADVFIVHKPVVLRLDARVFDLRRRASG